MYDRCLMCTGHMSFYGISIKPTWLRWLFCDKDETFVAADEFGTAVLMTKRLPKEAYFPVFKDKRE